MPERIPHKARGYYNVIEELNELRNELSNPGQLDEELKLAVDIREFISSIDKIIEGLKAMVTATADASPDDVHQKLQQEGQNRAAGQAERQKRLAPCKSGDGKKKKPTRPLRGSPGGFIANRRMRF